MGSCGKRDSEKALGRVMLEHPGRGHDEVVCVSRGLSESPWSGGGPTSAPRTPKSSIKRKRDKSSSADDQPAKAMAGVNQRVWRVAERGRGTSSRSVTLWHPGKHSRTWSSRALPACGAANKPTGVPQANVPRLRAMPLALETHLLLAPMSSCPRSPWGLPCPALKRSLQGETCVAKEGNEDAAI